MKQRIRINENQLKKIVNESVKKILTEENEAERLHSEIQQYVYNCLKNKYGNLVDGDPTDFVVALPGTSPEYISINIGFGCY